MGALFLVGALVLLKFSGSSSPGVASTSAKSTSKNAAPNGSAPPAETPATVDVRASGETLTVTEQPRFMIDAEGHTGPINRLAFAPDGRYVVSTSFDKTVRVWDVASSETVRVIRLWIGEDTDGVGTGVAVSPDGKTLAVAGIHRVDGRKDAGCFVFLIDLATGKVVKALKGHTDMIGAVAFSPDGKRLASGGRDDGALILWNVATGQSEQVLKGHTKIIKHLNFSPDGERILVCAEDSSCYIWSVSKATLEARFTGKPPILCNAWSPDGKTMAAGHQGGLISISEPNGKLLKKYEGVSVDRFTSVSFTPDGRELLFTGVRGPGSTRPGCGILDLTKGEERNGSPFHLGAALHGALSPDGKLAVTCGLPLNAALVWRVSDSWQAAHFFGKGRFTNNIAWTADGNAFACGGLDPVGLNRTDFLHRTFDLRNFEFGPAPVGNVVRGQMRLGNKLLVITPQGHLTVVDTASNTILRTFKPDHPQSRVLQCAWLPDGRVVLSEIRRKLLWDPEANRIVREFTSAVVGDFQAIAAAPNSRYFLTGGRDQTFRIWDPEQSQPLLSFFFTEQDWVAWTEEGIYAASPGGEQLIGWHINNGADQTASFYPAAQFRRSLYHPDVIRQVLAAGSVEAAFQRAGKKYTRGLNVLNLLPPVVAITSPAGLGGVSLEQGRFEVKATARSVGRNPVTKVQLVVDGRPYGGSGGARVIAKPQPGEVQLSWKVDLPPGVHLLSVLAESAVSRSVAPPVEVRVAGQTAGLPNLYVLAIGINAYPGDLKLNYAAGDADAIVESFQKQRGPVFGKVEAKIVKDRQATRQGIEQGLAWLAGKMTSRDVGLVSFSGHGDRDEQGNFYLIPVDVNARDLAGSCVSGEVLKKRLAAMPGRLVLLLDACHSGAAGAAQRRLGLTDDLVRDLISEEYGVVVLSSSRGDEYSLESDQARHGYFTLALVEALQGKSEVNKDGYVYLNDIDFYTLRRVRELSGNLQTPVMAKPRTIRSFALGKH
jgi:WD40 repeat protein